MSGELPAPKVIVLMGVCGVGKTTIGRALAEAIGAAFEEGDSFHPPANVAKMKGGAPLDDGDRAPWLAAMASAIGGWLGRPQPTVLACSALKQAYRDVLAAGRPRIAFVHLTGAPALIAERMAGRTDHYMPPSLLPSQLAILEPPSDAVAVAIDRPPPAIVRDIVARLGLAMR
ncbi:MAG: gluconokinase [Alphaproteobacteria bacterium]